MDVATRFPEAVPLKCVDKPAIAEALLSVVSRVGCPTEILSDRATQFTSDLIKELFRLLSVDHLTAFAYHAQTNGLVERFNGTLKTMLRKMASEKSKDLDRYVSALRFAYREMPNESTGFLPFELFCGRPFFERSGQVLDGIGRLRTHTSTFLTRRTVWKRHADSLKNLHALRASVTGIIMTVRYACTSSVLVMKFCCSIRLYVADKVERSVHCLECFWSC